MGAMAGLLVAAGRHGAAIGWLLGAPNTATVCL
jgi:hypothetical protein